MSRFNPIIDSTNCMSLLSIDLAAAFDVRMKQCWVILEGARRKNEQDADPVIDVNVAFTGGFRVTKARGIEFQFLIYNVQTGWRYQYELTHPKVVKEIRTAQEDPKARMLTLDKSDTRARRPVQSPLAEWSVWWDDDLVDVSQVESIHLLVDATYRAREHGRPGARPRRALIPPAYSRDLPPKDRADPSPRLHS